MSTGRESTDTITNHTEERTLHDVNVVIGRLNHRKIMAANCVLGFQCFLGKLHVSLTMRAILVLTHFHAFYAVKGCIERTC